jgi:drug/metabolite transporter (DMT)-like permease
VPIIVAVLAWLTGGSDRLTVTRWAGLLAGLAGVALLAGRSAGGGAGNGRPLQQMHERAYGRRAVCGLNCVELSGVAALEVDPRR